MSRVLTSRMARRVIVATLPGRCALCPRPVEPGHEVVPTRAGAPSRWAHRWCAAEHLRSAA